jgi:plasmid maintenance system killer protein
MPGGLKAVLAQIHMASPMDERIIFRFKDGNVTDVDYLDYH